jgi:hypothetical protein
MLRHRARDYRGMANMLADFPADRFDIVAFCICGHQAVLDLSRIPPWLLIGTVRSRLRCRRCGAQEASIRVVWKAAGGFKHSAL